ncbi:hypothetical protein PLICRDRAFT_168562 [Plicaturopsis crispa FD-325 SS-3]|uniref:FAD/NAD(P)-binding domain-containing protein n=1 Tax=Plicaturopsis crispa FD-325 SS-3 TaxID=944288 RepID=A0A0C9T774_PLICR|nr:hypothetical protein PLICRDRAFT_168562 [Plicaturopsis crispa FD-325 SS-3]
MSSSSSKEKKTVLIIGAGPAGLGAIEQFKRKGFEVVVYEARDVPGGLWNLDNPPRSSCEISFTADGRAIALSPLERSGLPAPVPSPLYPSVTANTPRDIMPYRSHPYPPHTIFLPTQETIRAYLHAYAAQYTESIRFGRVVTRVRWTDPEGGEGKGEGKVGRAGEPPEGHKRWTVEWAPAATKEPTPTPTPTTTVDQFDHIVIANGSDTRPHIPYLPGLWAWRGEVLHSRWYKEAGVFAGQTVLVVGNGPSGSDIARELGLLVVDQSKEAPRRVYQSIRSPPRTDSATGATGAQSSKESAATQSPSTSQTGRITLTNGQTLDDVDVIIFATSYYMRFEFLRGEDMPWGRWPVIKPPPPELVGSIEVDGGSRAYNLDEHQLFYYPDPSIAFLLLHAEAIPWPFSEVQARAAAYHWSAGGDLESGGHPGLEIKPFADEETDGHGVLVLGHPGEFIYTENLLRLIGEGGEEEVSADGKWGAWPGWKKEIRAAID